MRSLTKQQKKMLDEWFLKQKKNGKTFGYFWNVGDDDDFDSDLYQQIDDLNPCEIFYQNVNNYIIEKENNYWHYKTQ